MTRDPDGPVLALIHAPGLDWALAHDLVDAGRMPALSGLIDTGAIGKLLAPRPMTGPAAAMTLATGVGADRHGIFGHVAPREDASGLRPIGRRDLATPPLWDIAAAAGAPSAAIGWPATHPAPATPPAAQAGSALVISDGFARPRGAGFDDWPLAPGDVSDPAAAEALADLRLHPADVDAGMILPFVPDAARIDQETDERLGFLVRTLARAATLHAAGTWAVEGRAHRLVALHLDLLEHAFAAFMQHRAPRMAHVTRTDHEIFRLAADAALLFFDLLLARYQALLRPGDGLILASAYGWRTHPLRTPPPDARFRLHPDPAPLGVLAIHGPGVRRDALVFGADARDVAPTALALLGLAAEPPLEGRALLDAFDAPPALRPAPVPAPPPPPEPDPQDEAARWEALVKFGLAPRGGATSPVAAERQAAQRALATAFLRRDRRDPEGAEAACQEALDLRPDHAGAQLTLARIRLSAGDDAGAQAALDELAAARRPSAEADVLRAKLAYRAGDRAAAAEHLARARADPLAASRTAAGLALLLKIGRAQLAGRDFDAAEASFTAALALDPDAAVAHGGLGAGLLARGRHAQALDHLNRSLGGLQRQPDVLCNLAACHAALGDYDAAEASLLRALDLSPDFRPARTSLARLRGGRIKDLLRSVAEEGPA